ARPLAGGGVGRVRRPALGPGGGGPVGGAAAGGARGAGGAAAGRWRAGRGGGGVGGVGGCAPDPRAAAGVVDGGAVPVGSAGRRPGGGTADAHRAWRGR